MARETRGGCPAVPLPPQTAPRAAHSRACSVWLHRLSPVSWPCARHQSPRESVIVAVAIHKDIDGSACFHRVGGITGAVMGVSRGLQSSVIHKKNGASPSKNRLCEAPRHQQELLNTEKRILCPITSLSLEDTTPIDGAATVSGVSTHDSVPQDRHTWSYRR